MLIDLFAAHWLCKVKIVCHFEARGPIIRSTKLCHANSSAKPNGRITISSDKSREMTMWKMVNANLNGKDRGGWWRGDGNWWRWGVRTTEYQHSHICTSLYLVLSINHHFTTFHWKHPCLLRLSNHRHDYYARICPGGDGWCIICIIPTVVLVIILVSLVLTSLHLLVQGFRSNHVVQSPIPNEAGAKVKMAQVLFDSPDLAVVAKDAMDGFLLKKGEDVRAYIWLVGVSQKCIYSSNVHLA